MIDITQKTEILVETLPYLQKFAGKTVVVKYGGNAMVNEDLKRSVIQDIVLMKCIGIRPIIVHGGGPEITAMLKQLGKKSEFVAGLRVTDEETATVAQMVLAGKINSDIVSMINQFGGRAVGLNGKDSDLIVAQKKLATVYENGEPKEVDIGFVGDVIKVNANIIEILLNNGYIPVIAPIGVGLKGETYNINADYVAGEIAPAVKAAKLMLLTDVEGIYRNYPDKDSFISTLSFSEAQEMVRTGSIDGGMIPKVEACIRAIAGGVEKTHIIDGRQPHSLLLEVFTATGIGTEVVSESGRG